MNRQVWRGKNGGFFRTGDLLGADSEIGATGRMASRFALKIVFLP